LAYSSASLETKIWIGFFGFLVPFLFGLWALPAQPLGGTKLLNDETFKAIPPWVVWAVFGLGLLVRLYALLNSNWICLDEGCFSEISMELHKKWEWHFFFTTAQHPPLCLWSLSFFYHLFPPSVFSARFFNFLTGALALALSFLASRLFLSKSSSLLCFVLFSFGFWPLLFCEFCEPLVSVRSRHVALESFFL